MKVMKMTTQSQRKRKREQEVLRKKEIAHHLGKEI
jgi:hypothetical protein